MVKEQCKKSERKVKEREVKEKSAGKLTKSESERKVKEQCRNSDVFYHSVDKSCAASAACCGTTALPNKRSQSATSA